jgi:hypothetical protein
LEELLNVSAYLAGGSLSGADFNVMPVGDVADLLVVPHHISG